MRGSWIHLASAELTLPLVRKGLFLTAPGLLAPQGLLKASAKAAAWEGPQSGEKGSLLTFAQGAHEAGAAETLA